MASTEQVQRVLSGDRHASLKKTSPWIIYCILMAAAIGIRDYFPRLEPLLPKSSVGPLNLIVPTSWYAVARGTVLCLGAAAAFPGPASAPPRTGSLATEFYLAMVGGSLPLRQLVLLERAPIIFLGWSRSVSLQRSTDAYFNILFQCNPGDHNCNCNPHKNSVGVADRV